MTKKNIHITHRADGDWADGRPAEPSGRWWAPIAIGTVSLVLLGLLGFAIAVIVRDSEGEVETPATPAVRATTTEPAAPDVTTPPTVTETITTPPTTDAADREVTVLRANAYRDSELIRGEGDAVATAIYAQAFEQDPEFYAFTRSLRAYQDAFQGNGDILLVRPDSEFFRYLKDSKGGQQQQ